MLQRPLNYEVKKHDKQNYSIIYRGNKPKVLYLNDRPIYITPGDHVQLEYLHISELLILVLTVNLVFLKMVLKNSILALCYNRNNLI